MFKNNIIEKKVMSVVKQRIDIAQQKYDDGVDELEAKLEADKEALAQKHAEDIVGKIL